MGVPKFFRWISERYPCLSVSVDNNQIPNFDCLYLDMNGIIHICSHPDDSNVTFRITESDIFNNIFNYIEFLFKTVKPKDVFFLAVDGVAPRAKMNQQRARRFKSAKEAINREVAALQSGIKLPDEKRFDSNAITPGTEFMDRLQKALELFLQEKTKTDSLWQGVDIVLSGHETPGEGEHKIQEFIRYRRSLPNYNPNTKHCLYGLDADLMLLGLASHEPYFSLLREEVTFSKKKTKRAYIAEESKFFLLHLSLLREYIDYEFNSLKAILENEYSLERIIDDWIIMSFLVGNDFVPHLPNLHIHTSALPFLWETYIKQRPLMNGYINNYGKLNLDNLLHYIKALSNFDVEIFLENYEDMKWMMGKTGERLGNELQNLDKNKSQFSKKTPLTIINDKCDEATNLDTSLADFFNNSLSEITERMIFTDDTQNDHQVCVQEDKNTDESPTENISKVKESSIDSETDQESLDTCRSNLLLSMAGLTIDKNLIDFDFDENDDILNECLEETVEIKSSVNFGITSLNDDGDSEIWELQYRCYKRDYYYSKMGLTSSEEVLVEQAKEYITALQWISYYYFCGVPSWGWFYPQHYTPFISDLSYLSDDIKKNGITFDIGVPFLPFQQLMAVLPADSCELLPTCYQPLMTEEKSPIIDFYPKTFKTDLNGKKKEWEAVVLIPFIDENRLLEALAIKYSWLSSYEVQRNVHGPHIKYRFSNGNLTVSNINPELFRIPISSIVTGLCPNVRIDVICQGFPTFQYIPHTFILEKVGVKIFEFSANSSSILLKITPPTQPTEIDIVARSFIGKVAYVNWPAFNEVKVVSVLDETNKFITDPKSNLIMKQVLDESDINKMKEYKATVAKTLFRRSAISIDESNFIILETVHSDGKSYEISGTHKAGSTVRLANNWNYSKTFWHLHQLSVLKESINVLESNSSKTCSKLNQLLPKDGIVFSLDNAHYGRVGHVQSINNLTSLINVKLELFKDFDLSDMDLTSVDEEYMIAARAAEYININPLLFSRITGTLYINTSSVPQSDGTNHLKKSDRNKPQCSIGLDLKNNKSNLQIPGWVKKIKCDNQINKWLYSMRVVRVLEQYSTKFPEIFDFIQKPHFESLSMEQVFDKSVLTSKIAELTEFLNSQPYRILDKISNDNRIVCESNIKMIEKYLDDDNDAFKIEKTTNIELHFKELYRPHYSLNGVNPDKNAVFELHDKVVCCTDGYTVPLGLHGIVIGIEPKFNDDLRLEVLFVKEFKSAIIIRGSKARCYRMPVYTLINISHGKRQGGMSSPLKSINDHNSNKIKSSVKRENCLTVASPRMINVSTSSSEIKPVIINTKKSVDIDNVSPMPPMPPTEFFIDNNRVTLTKTPNNQKNFIAHCDKLFVKESPNKSFITTFTIYNCIPEYSQLFTICLQSGIQDPRIIERHVDNQIYMSFTSNIISLPEVREYNIDIGRANTINRVWNYIFPQWGTQQMNNGDVIHRMTNQHKHHYMPEQFENNPFMQVYPEQLWTNQNTSTRHHNKNGISPKKTFPNSVTNVNIDETAPSQKKQITNLTKKKPFIKAPKPNLSFQ